MNKPFLFFIIQLLFFSMAYVFAYVIYPYTPLGIIYEVFSKESIFLANAILLELYFMKVEFQEMKKEMEMYKYGKKTNKKNKSSKSN